MNFESVTKTISEYIEILSQFVGDEEAVEEINLCKDALSKRMKYVELQFLDNGETNRTFFTYGEFDTPDELC